MDTPKFLKGTPRADQKATTSLQGRRRPSRLAARDALAKAHHIRPSIWINSSTRTCLRLSLSSTRRCASCPCTSCSQSPPIARSPQFAQSVNNERICILDQTPIRCVTASIAISKSCSDSCFVSLTLGNQGYWIRL